MKYSAKKTVKRNVSNENRTYHCIIDSS